MTDFVRDIQLGGHETRGQSPWDLLIIGGGATGIGVALDAASRGYSVCLLEQADFGKGTSSRSTKLVHGGVRYLKQGNIALVREALRERALLLKNAPHVVHDLPFIIPCDNLWQAFFYGMGLKTYDFLAGKRNLAPSTWLSSREVLARVPTLNPSHSSSGILYHDGQFDDARLLINMAQAAVSHGACLMNYARVTGFTTQSSGQIDGVRWSDQESGREWTSRARVVINATGPFCDQIRRMENPESRPMLAASQGVHLVLPKRFLPGDTAIMVPKTSDGRVVFLIPWHDRVVLGTTDTPIDRVDLEPEAQPEEIDFLLETAGRYLAEPATRADILSIFTGIRPLVVANPGAKTSRLPRDHTFNLSDQGLLTITGGKWTTYRVMAEQCVDKAARQASLETRPCRTRELPIPETPTVNARSNSALSREPFDHRLPINPEHVVQAVLSEMARTVEDVLARRSRSLFLDAQAALDIAPRVVQIMAQELDRDDAWQASQLELFRETASHFLPK